MRLNKTEFPEWLQTLIAALMGGAGGIMVFSALMPLFGLELRSTGDGWTLLGAAWFVAFSLVLTVAILSLVGTIVYKRKIDAES